MEFLGWVILIIFIGVLLSIGQFVVSIIFTLLYMLLVLIIAPFIWVYEKIQERRA